MSTDAKTAEVTKPPKPRSPNHPVLTLQEAIEKTKVLHGKYGRTPVAVALACSNWKYSNPKSSGALQTIATLKAFGLIDVTGRSEAQKVVVTEAMERIGRNAPDREALLKVAAVSPQMHNEVWEHFGKQLPHDDILKQYLVWERAVGTRFTDDAVDGFIERLKSTLRYAGLVSDGGACNDENNSGTLDTLENGNGPEALHGKVQVGSFVQWTSQGVERFPSPRKVVGVDGDWAFVEGTRTGLPMNELAVVSPPNSAASTAPTNPYFTDDKKPLDMIEDKNNLEEGTVVLQWPKKLSKESVEELEYWLKGILRRARRFAGMAPEPSENDRQPS